MKKILIIDDDPDVRTVMNILMKKQGYDVETASDRKEAFSKIDSFKPSIILLDVLLSGADGREICHEIKSKEVTKNIHVIMISGHPGAAENINNYGADEFVLKPVNTTELLQKIDGLVKVEK
jgi:DNA-binding response OmpR family regulator